MKVLLVSLTITHLAFALPSPRNADTCSTSQCSIQNDCRCSSVVNPISDSNDTAPMLIAITVSESIVTTLYDDYLKPLFFDRKNPDGSPIGLTFYVNHEYTDYELVQNLYLRGHEIGVHSITKNASQEYWRHASLNDLVEEFGGQRQILSKFANIPIEDIVGVRTPQLQLEGDLSITAYKESGLSYDNTWPTSSSFPLFPYTLDYASTQECSVAITCPSEQHEHFWIAPITNIKGNNNVECSSFPTCLVQGTPEEISDWLVSQVDRVERNNRSPLVLRLDSYWFDFTGNSYEGFVLFLDEMERREDVFLVSVLDVISWVKDPVSVSNYERIVPERSAKCHSNNCHLIYVDGTDRYMKSCVPCPEVYPWKGNPFGEYRGFN